MPSAMQVSVGAVWAAQENMVFRLTAKTMYFLGGGKINVKHILVVEGNHFKLTPVCLDGVFSAAEVGAYGRDLKTKISQIC